MRFGKRNRNPLAMGWRGKPQSEDSEFSPVASEERDALLSTGPLHEENDHVSPPADDSHSIAIQRLSVALGRFERQVTKAMEGAPQEVWSDECMTQLINAVEIAVGEGWNEVVEALTETARVLQSYENQHQAHQAIPFLGDTYEVLGVMLGDLLRGRIRSGVMQKWRNRYRLALEELGEAGIPLVRDEEEPEPRTPPRPVAREYEPPKPAPRETEAPHRPAGILRSMYPVELEPDSEPYASSLDDTPEYEELPSTVEPETVVADETFGTESYDDAIPTAERQEEIGDIPSFMDELPPLAPLRTDLFDLDILGASEPRDATAGSDAAGATSPEVIERLDILCEQLSGMERDPQADRVTGFLSVLDSVAYLEDFAKSTGRAGCVDLCGMMARMCDTAEAQPGDLEDKFFELAYAFCGVYVEADDRADNTMIRSWIAECETLLSNWGTRSGEPSRLREEPELEATPFLVDEPAYDFADAPEPFVEFVESEDEATVEDVVEVIEEGSAPAEDEEPELVEPVVELVETEPLASEAPMELTETASVEIAMDEEMEPEAPVGSVDDGPALVTEDSPEALLSVAQQAMSLGRAADAKRMALRAAAMLAQMEVDDASKRVGEAESRLRQGADLIEQARQQVQQAERRVEEATQAVGGGEASLAGCKTQAETVGHQLREVEGRVAELDEQIRQLQMRRDEEARLLAETKTQLDEAHSLEAMANAELESLRKSEEEARIRLEDTRQRVKTLQRRRTEVEAAMERAREQLSRQRLSLAEIQQTLAQVGGRSEDAVDDPNEELLF